MHAVILFGALGDAGKIILHRHWLLGDGGCKATDAMKEASVVLQQAVAQSSSFFWAEIVSELLLFDEH